jgi:histidine triad (HIT) family protein
VQHSSPTRIDPTCAFCRVVSGDMPASIVAETNHAMAFMDINQPTPGHVLIIPRDHFVYLYDLDSKTSAELFGLTLDIAKAVKRSLKPDGLNLFLANEAAGQQSVFHCHMHVIARYDGDRDRIRFGWRNDLASRSELDDMAATIRSAL